MHVLSAREGKSDAMDGSHVANAWAVGHQNHVTMINTDNE
jgi:hypothetical protein